MEYAQADSPLPSISRWVRLCRTFRGSSTLRKLQYEHLGALPIQGRVLDVGGGDRAHYRSLLPTDIQYQSVNIDPAIEPTWIVDVGQSLPVDDQSIDTCLSMNTLEHVYQPHFLVEEMFRVLKPGGMMHVTVPWMFRIHGHPDDFLRMTPSWWRTTLHDAGFSHTQVTPLVWGRNSSALAIRGRSGMRGHLTHLKDAFAMHITRALQSSRKLRKRRQRAYNVALGHFISARR